MSEIHINVTREDINQLIENGTLIVPLDDAIIDQDPHLKLVFNEDDL